MKHWAYGICGILCICIIAIVIWIVFPGPVTTVILVRHGEKAEGAADPQNPPLSAAGAARATRLAHVLEDAGVQAIFVTQLIRTQETAVPLATQEGLTPVVIPVADVSALVADIRNSHTGDTVLVVGHSNTVPDAINQLTGQTVPAIDETTEFDNMYIISLRRFSSTVLRLKYGEPT